VETSPNICRRTTAFVRAHKYSAIQIVQLQEKYNIIIGHKKLHQIPSLAARTFGTYNVFRWSQRTIAQILYIPTVITGTVVYHTE